MFDSSGHQGLGSLFGAPDNDETVPVTEALPQQVENPSLEGVVTSITNGPSDRGEVTFVLVRPDHTHCKVTARTSFDIDVGMEVSIPRYWPSMHTLGEHFEATWVFERVPSDAPAYLKYCERVLRNAGEAGVRRLYAHFGQTLLDVVANAPGRLVEADGVSPAMAKAALFSYRRHMFIEAIWQVLGPAGAGGKVPARVFDKYRERTLEVIRERPYQLMDIEGVGFRLANRIAECSDPMGSRGQVRVMATIRHFMDESAEQGHTSVSLNFLRDAVLRECGPSELATFEDAVRRGVSSGSVFLRQIEGKQFLSSRTFVRAERRIAKALVGLAMAAQPDQELALLAEEACRHLNDPSQTAAVCNAFLNGVSVITGRPGCGKTTIAKVIADVAARANLRLIQCAPTNMAARRLESSTGAPAATIHHTFEYRPDSEAANPWQRNEENVAEGDLFIIDEFSMVDTESAQAAFSGIPPGARVVIIGDDDQLRSVAAGAVLSDIMQSGLFPVSRLRRPHRAAANSAITITAGLIAEGNAKAIDFAGEREYRHYEAVTEAQIKAKVVETYVALAEKHGQDNVQVLVAQHKTATGVDALNEMIRSVANPVRPGKQSLKLGGTEWRVGDRVLSTKNLHQQDVSNGEVGKIVGIDVAKAEIKISFGGRESKPFNRELMHGMKFAYAMTNHKTQGNEFAGVILVMPRAHSRMHDRNLFYTGFTRGKKDVCTIGDAVSIRRAVTRSGTRRMTGLKFELARVVEFLKDKGMEPPVIRLHGDRIEQNSAGRSESCPPPTAIVAQRRKHNP